MESPAEAPPPGESKGKPRIVGIGASAGGLAALEQFIAQVPPASGLAFIVVQHLDPTEKSLLPTLLQRVTTMRVQEAAEKMRVEPDCVYVIPPNAAISVVAGVLQAEMPAEPRGLRLPINTLFSSLAREQGGRAIGVILSGMGSDGTLGLRAIKARGGLTVVQEPKSAQFDSMPLSAIAAGCAKIVAHPADLPARILEHITQFPAGSVPLVAATGGPPETEFAVQLAHIVKLLHQRTRHDFSLYKPSTLRRRIERRMAIHAIASQTAYTDFLRDNAQEIDLLFKELLIGVTGFFRDPAVWQHLADVALPELLDRRDNTQKFRAWVIGCSTGEEAYSLAMVFAEVVARLPQHRDCSLQIFASDLSADAIATARRGRYPEANCADLSPDRIAKFFSVEDGYCQIGKNLRDTVLFAQQDVIRDPPFTRLDLLSCRNLMIYFDATLQNRLIPLFHYSLKPGGVLIMGNSETVGRFSRLFAPIASKLRLYLRLDHGSSGGPAVLVNSIPPLKPRPKELSVSPPSPPAHAADNLQKAADHVLLQVHAPPAVLVNGAGDIVYLSGHTGKYLEPAAGKANWNFHAMVREGLRVSLASALHQATTQSEPVHLRELRVQIGKDVQVVDVTVHALSAPASLKGMVMVVFRDVAQESAGRRRRKSKGAVEVSHAAELERYRDEIQTLREQTQAAHEELQSTNEELQSTNEELTTSKEEMQSMNEELQTINSEMQVKLDDLALAQSDMRNLLNSTNIAMLFLDKDLNVRRYTDRALKIISLRESDIGRPLSDLTTSLNYPALHEDVIETVRTLVFSEKQVTSADNRWFTVRIMPYRKLDNMIDGAVITFVDITAIKELEARLRERLDSAH